MPSWPIIDDATREVFARIAEDGSWGRYHGPHCDALIAALCEYHRIEHSLLCSSGTCAIELALRSIPVCAGDEVILSAYDFKANFVNVLTTGCVPVLIDTQAEYPIPDISQIVDAFSERTRAVIVSHLHGNLVPMREVCRIAAQRGVAVIEDACQAPGAMIDGRRAGTYGDVGVLSFGGSKLLTSGRGGAVLTANAQMAQRIRLYTQRGNDAYPISEMQAAILLPQLSQLDARNAHRHQRILEMVAAMKMLPDAETSAAGVARYNLKVAMNLPDQSQAESNLPAYYKSAFLLRDGMTEVQRIQICDAIRNEGVPVDPGFSGLHKIHSRQRFRTVNDLPNATQFHQRLITLHHTALLTSSEAIHRIAEMLG